MRFTKIKVKREFIDWATGFAGMEGNPKGPLWFCGIENAHSRSQKFLSDLDFQISKRYSYVNKRGERIPCWNDKFKEDFSDYHKWRYNQCVAKIACEYFRFNEHMDIKDRYKKYMKKRLFTERGETFRANLYPIAFTNAKDSHWTKKHKDRTGFSTKKEYKEWCRVNRFKFMHQLAAKHKPKVILCSGIGYSREFQLAFRPEKIIGHIPEIKAILYQVNSGKTIMVTVPFLGRDTMNRNEALQDIGKFLSKI